MKHRNSRRQCATITVQTSFNILILVVKEKEQWGCNQSKLQAPSHSCSANIVESLGTIFLSPHEWSWRHNTNCGLEFRQYVQLTGNIKRYTQTRVPLLYWRHSKIPLNVLCKFPTSFIARFNVRTGVYSAPLGSNFGRVGRFSETLRVLALGRSVKAGIAPQYATTHASFYFVYNLFTNNFASNSKPSNQVLLSSTSYYCSVFSTARCNYWRYFRFFPVSPGRCYHSV